MGGEITLVTGGDAGGGETAAEGAVVGVFSSALLFLTADFLGEDFAGGAGACFWDSAPAAPKPAEISSAELGEESGILATNLKLSSFTRFKPSR